MIPLGLPPSAREVDDPSHPHVRLSSRDVWSEQDLDRVGDHLRSSDWST